MAERFNQQQAPGHEKLSQEALERANQERRAELAERHNEQELRTPEKAAVETEAARHEALEKAQERKEIAPQERAQAERRGRISKEDANANFNTTMKEVRSEMNAPSRIFSKVIHNKVVEKTSEVVGSTIARPNAILSGAIFAFLLTLGVYIVAKNLGYPLSGFETIAAFAGGWIIGIAYDFIKIMITGRK